MTLISKGDFAHSFFNKKCHVFRKNAMVFLTFSSMVFYLFFLQKRCSQMFPESQLLNIKLTTNHAYLFVAFYFDFGAFFLVHVVFLLFFLQNTASSRYGIFLFLVFFFK